MLPPLVEVCPPLGEGWPNVGRALGNTYVDNLKPAPSWSQPHAVGTLGPRWGVFEVVKVATTWVSPRNVENPIPICANVHLCIRAVSMNRG